MSIQHTLPILLVGWLVTSLLLTLIAIEGGKSRREAQSRIQNYPRFDVRASLYWLDGQ